MIEDEMVDGITDSMHLSLSKLWEMVRDRGAWCAVLHGITVRHDLATEKQHNMLIYSKARKNKIKVFISTGFHPQRLQLYMNLPFLETLQIAKVPWLPGSDSPYCL